MYYSNDTHTNHDTTKIRDPRDDKTSVVGREADIGVCVYIYIHTYT